MKWVYVCPVSLLFLPLLKRFLLEGPINYQFPLIQLLALHLPDGTLRLLKASILDQRVPLGIARLAIHVQMQTLDLAVLGKGIEDVVLLRLLVQVAHDQNPTLDC